eukprot:Gb_25647 [translate_table: standard]
MPCYVIIEGWHGMVTGTTNEWLHVTWIEYSWLDVDIFGECEGCSISDVDMLGERDISDVDSFGQYVDMSRNYSMSYVDVFRECIIPDVDMLGEGVSYVPFNSQSNVKVLNLPSCTRLDELPELNFLESLTRLYLGGGRELVAMLTLLEGLIHMNLAYCS